MPLWLTCLSAWKLLLCVLILWVCLDRLPCVDCFCLPSHAMCGLSVCLVKTLLMTPCSVPFLTEGNTGWCLYSPLLPCVYLYLATSVCVDIYQWCILADYMHGTYWLHYLQWIRSISYYMPNTNNMFITPPLMPGDTGGVVGLATVLQQQPQSQMPSKAYIHYAKGPLQVSFSFKVEHPTNLLIYAFLLSGAMLDAIFTNGGTSIWVCTTAAFGAYPWQAYVHHGDGHQPMLGMHQVAVPSAALTRVPYATYATESPDPPTCLHGKQGSSF